MSHALWLLSLWMTNACQAEAQSIDQKYKLQIDNEARTRKFCGDQWINATYLSAIEKGKGQVIPLDGDLMAGLAGYHFVVNTGGIQGVNSGVLQQDSGKWKCDRGIIDKPMILGKEYVNSSPVYEPMPGCSPYVRVSGSGMLMPPPPRCFSSSRLIGHVSTSRMLKDESCSKGARCLVLYYRNELGKVSRYLIGVSYRSLQSLFPYSLTRDLSTYYGYKYFAGPVELDCFGYPEGMGRDVDIYMRERYRSCLAGLAEGWE